MKVTLKQLAYYAGLFDGEGGIYIEKQKPKQRYKSPKYQLVVQLTNNYEPVIDEMIKLFNGYKRIRYRGNPNPIYDWRTTTRNAVKFLRLMEPRLKIKKEQVKLGIEFQALMKVGKQSLSDDENRQRENYHQRIKQLNRARSNGKYRAKPEREGVETRHGGLKNETRYSPNTMVT